MGKLIFSIALLWLILLFKQFFPSLSPLHFWIIVTDLVILAGCFSLFIFFCKDETKDPPSYTVPRSLDPAQAGFILDGYVDDKDIMALFMDWGIKGYLQIEVSNGEILFKREKKMPIPLISYQSTLFNHLFEKANIVFLKGLVEAFFPYVAEAKGQVDQYFQEPKNHVYSLESLALQRLFSALLAIPFSLCFLATYVHQMSLIDSYTILAILLVAFSIAISLTFPIKSLIQILYHRHSMAPRELTIKSLLGLLYAIGLFAFFGGYCFSEVPVLTIITLSSTLILTLMAGLIKKRTPQGHEWFNQLFCLRKFMTEASEETISRLLQDNPLYYLETLPFAYVMGISREWSEKFKDSPLPSALWFINKDEYPEKSEAFHECFIKHFHEIKTVLTSRPPKQASPRHPI